MNTAQLRDVALINPRGYAVAAHESVSFVGMAQLDAAQALARPLESRLFAEVSKGYTIFQDGDILAAKITPCWENGKIGQARLDHKIGIGSTEFHVVRPGPDLDERYLLHFLRQPMIRTTGELRMTGSAGQRRVPAAFLQDLRIPVPRLDEQRRIAAILDQADATRAMRRQVLDHLDTLTQSIFRDMFGNVRTNEMNWPSGTIEGVAERVTDGEHKTPQRSNSGVPLLSARNVRDGWINFENVDFVDELEYAKLSQRIEPRPGDILISCSGTIGRVAQVRDNSRFAMVRSVALVRPLRSIEPAFLECLLASPELKALMIYQANSSAQANLFQNQIKQLPIFVPSFELQRKFTAHAEQVNAQQAVARRALDADNELFASLQARAFRGEL